MSINLNSWGKLLTFNFLKFSLTIVSGILTPYLIIKDHNLSGFGYYALAQSIAILVFFIFDFGLNQSYVREKGEESFFTLLTFKFISSICSSIILYLISLLPFVSPELSSLLIIFSLFSIIFILQSFVSQVYIAEGFLKLNIIGEVIMRLSYIFFLFISELLGGNLNSFIYILALSIALQSLFLLSNLFRFNIFSIHKVSLLNLKDLFFRSLKYYTISIAQFFYFRINILTLSFVSTPSQVGLFSLVFRGAEVISEIGYSSSVYFFKELDKDKDRYVNNSIKILIYIGILIASLGLFFGVNLSDIFTISRNDIAIPLFLVLLAGILMSLNNLGITRLLSERNFYSLNKFYILMIFIQLISMLILGKFFGALGGSIVSFVLESIFFLFLFIRDKFITKILLRLSPYLFFGLVITQFDTFILELLLLLTIVNVSVLGFFYNTSKNFYLRIRNIFNLR